MESDITKQERKTMEEFLKAHPIDPAWDEECEMFDGWPPEDQMTARIYKKILDDNPEPPSEKS